MKYKIGDKLKCILGYGPNFHINKIYTIIDMYESLNGYYGWYRFKEVKYNRSYPFIEDPRYFIKITRSMKLKRILE